MRGTGLFTLAVALATLGAGCERVAVEGRATDATGEALPGVVVRLEGTSQQDLTDALGQYRLTASRSAKRVGLKFSKSGYAPTRIDVELRGPLSVKAADVPLWRLPSNPGAYTWRAGRYIPADWVLPSQYYLKDGGEVYGVELPETLRVEVSTDAWWIATYRTPRYNARLSRLAPAEATLPGVGTQPVQIWTESGTIPAGLESIDPLEGHLQRVVVDRPLQPGVYAVHWGAIEGYTTLEGRIYVFRVVEPPAEDIAEGAEHDVEEAAPAAPGSGPPDAIEPPADEASAVDGATAARDAPESDATSAPAHP